MEQKFEKTPQEFEEMLKSMGMTDEKTLKNQVKVYEKGYKEAQKEKEGVFDTQTSVEYVNKELKNRKLIKNKRDKYHVKKFLEEMKAGKVAPIDPAAPKKHGFHFEKEELDRFVDWVERVKTADVEALLKEIEELKAENEQLKNLKTPTSDSKEEKKSEGLKQGQEDKNQNLEHYVASDDTFEVKSVGHISEIRVIINEEKWGVDYKINNIPFTSPIVKEGEAFLVPGAESLNGKYNFNTNDDELIIEVIEKKLIPKFKKELDSGEKIKQGEEE